jgi:hypothetical protein
VAKPHPVGKWAGKQHHHACTRCRRRYHDACETPAVDGVCNSCRTGRLSTWVAATEPRPCCLTDAMPADRYDRDKYLLAGPGPWWVCRTCARQFPTQPKEVR